MIDQTGEFLAVAHSLEPYTDEMLGLVQRERSDGRPHLMSRDSGEQVTADYLVKVDGEDLVVTSYDQTLSPERLRKVVVDAQDPQSETLLNTTPSALGQLDAAIRRIRSDVPGQLFYTGSVSVQPRDAYDMGGESNAFMLGSMAYTLRQGEQAMLMDSGYTPEDPDLFMRAVRAVNLEDRIDYRTLFTPDERQQHAEMYQPVFHHIRCLLEHDGANILEAGQRYADLAQLEQWSGSHILGQIGGEAMLADMFTTLKACRAASYVLGHRDHLFIADHRRDDGRVHYGYTVVRERQTDSGIEVTTYEQPRDNKALLVINQPTIKGEDDNYQYSRTHRLFLASETQAAVLRALLETLV